MGESTRSNRINSLFSLLKSNKTIIKVYKNLFKRNWNNLNYFKALTYNFLIITLLFALYWVTKLILLIQILYVGQPDGSVLFYVWGVCKFWFYYTGFIGSLAIIAGVLDSTKLLTNFEVLLDASSYWYIKISRDLTILPYFFWKSGDFFFESNKPLGLILRNLATITYNMSRWFTFLLTFFFEILVYRGEQNYLLNKWEYFTSERFEIVGNVSSYNTITLNQLKLSYKITSFVITLLVSWLIFNLFWLDLVWLVGTNPKACLKSLSTSTSSIRRFCTFSMEVEYENVWGHHPSWSCDRLRIAHFFSRSPLHNNIPTPYPRFNQTPGVQYISPVNVYGKIWRKGRELPKNKILERKIMKNSILDMYPSIIFCDELEQFLNKYPEDLLKDKQLVEKIINELREKNEFYLSKS